jgi:methylaspartate mutase epsilon subunit
MGFGASEAMRLGLRAVNDARARTAGTITVDSFTRVGDHAAAGRALAAGRDLNGYPLVFHGSKVTRDVLAGIGGSDFPVQVRHGAAVASDIVRVTLDSGIGATEGGPVSYCLPYGRQPLREAVTDWRRSCELLAQAADSHLESFGGCLMGQLCPPSLLVAMSVLECLFFRQHGVHSVSLSYAQQTNFAQDVEAVGALRDLAGEFLGPTDWHTVIYTYMGLFPQSAAGALALLDQSVLLAVHTGAERLIVKTPAEAHGIATVADNVLALERADGLARRLLTQKDAGGWAESGPGGEVYGQARALVEMVLDQHRDIGEGLARSFERGLLDIPYCLHPDNHNRARAALDRDGRLYWANAGAMPVPAESPGPGRVGSDELLTMLSFVRRRFDASGRAGTMPVVTDGVLRRG